MFFPSAIIPELQERASGSFPEYSPTTIRNWFGIIGRHSSFVQA